MHVLLDVMSFLIYNGLSLKMLSHERVAQRRIPSV